MKVVLKFLKISEKEKGQMDMDISVVIKGWYKEGNGNGKIQ